jgi:hypothetical protein
MFINSSDLIILILLFSELYGLLQISKSFDSETLFLGYLVYSINCHVV